MDGGDGNDNLGGYFANMYGGNGNDTLDGEYSSLYGGDGDDILTTDHGRMSGGRGNDTLNGGGDTFYVFSAPSEGVDTINGFLSDYGDQIVVSASGFGGGLTAGAAITPEQFRIGTAAADASDRFIYKNANGALFFDPTGSINDAADQVRFATLVGAPGITSNDIFVDV